MQRRMSSGALLQKRSTVVVPLVEMSSSSSSSPSQKRRSGGRDAAKMYASYAQPNNNNASEQRTAPPATVEWDATLANSVTLIGNCGGDPELRVLPSGKMVCEVSIAVNQGSRQQQQSGEMMENDGKTAWYTVVAWDEEACACPVRAQGQLAVRARKIGADRGWISKPDRIGVKRRWFEPIFFCGERREHDE